MQGPSTETAHKFYCKWPWPGLCNYLQDQYWICSYYSQQGKRAFLPDSLVCVMTPQPVVKLKAILDNIVHCTWLPRPNSICVTAFKDVILMHTNEHLIQTISRSAFPYFLFFMVNECCVLPLWKKTTEVSVKHRKPLDHCKGH